MFSATSSSFSFVQREMLRLIAIGAFFRSTVHDQIVAKNVGRNGGNHIGGEYKAFLASPSVDVAGRIFGWLRCFLTLDEFHSLYTPLPSSSFFLLSSMVSLTSHHFPFPVSFPHFFPCFLGCSLPIGKCTCKPFSLVLSFLSIPFLLFLPLPPPPPRASYLHSVNQVRLFPLHSFSFSSVPAPFSLFLFPILRSWFFMGFPSLSHWDRNSMR